MNLPSPKVSVVVPAFRGARTIGETIDSILAQSMANLEVVICDDASDDDTCSVVLGYRDPRVRLIRSSTNLGPGRARDMAIAAALGEWVAVIDADDAWKPNRLERLLAAANEDTNVIVFDNIMICHHSRKGLIPWRALRSQGAFSSAERHRPYEVSLAAYLRSDRLLIKPLIHREALLHLGARHSDRRFGEDAEYFIRLGLAGLRFRYVPQPMYLYRAMPGSATAQAEGHHLMRECIEELAEIPGVAPEIAAAFDAKIMALKRQERLYMLADAVRGFRLIRALWMVAHHPELALYAPRFVLQRMQRMVHGLFHAGQSR